MTTEQNASELTSTAITAPVTVKVKITDIALRADWQVRNRLDQVFINKYRNVYVNGGGLPPIQLARVDGTLILVDGWHRLEALRLNDSEDAEATITDRTANEARWAAAEANTRHGLPLKPSEIRNVFRAYIKSRRHREDDGWVKSYRTMATELGSQVSYRTLNNWMKKDFPKIAREMAEQYGEDDKARHQGADGPPQAPDEMTALQAAKANLDSALAEARSMSGQDRAELSGYAQELFAGIFTATAWTLKEVPQENPDF